MSMHRRTFPCPALSVAIAAIVALFMWPAHATPLTVVNHGFEDISGESPFNEFTFGPFNGWSLYDPGAITDGGDGPSFFIGTLTPRSVGGPPPYEFFPTGAQEGSRVAIAFNFFTSRVAGEYGLQQTLADTLQPNTTYTLEVDIGNIASGFDVLNNFYNLGGFPGYRVDLLAGGVAVASDDNSLAGLIPEGEFATSTIEFTTGATHPRLGQALGIRLVNLNVIDGSAPTADLEIDFDDVRLSAVPVPEPSTWMLVAASLLVAKATLAGLGRLTG
jgi:hapalindole H/12-epi-hapalindole U/12-epi-fischerindole U synthase